jgi:hypothetical protein
MLKPQKVISSFALVLIAFALAFDHLADLKSTGRAEREPANYGAVVQELQQLILQVRDPRAFRADTATSIIHQFADRAYALNADQYLPLAETDRLDFIQRADQLVKDLFETRLLLREKQRVFEAQWSAAERESAVDAFRRAHLYLRYAEDHAIELLNRERRWAPNPTYFSGGFPRTLTTTGGAPDFKPGDVFLVRGGSFVSATIARSGDAVTNMSHLAMIGVNEAGELRVVESLLEKGLVEYSLEDYLKTEPLPRVAIYRFRDQAVAEQAAREVWSLYRESEVRPIPFDVSMDVHDHSKVYCAEAVAIAYKRAGEKLRRSIQLPSTMTSFRGARQTVFFQEVGMNIERSFAPADLDVDTRFDLIGEHRDLSLLAKSRRFDVVLSILFDRFKQGYTYRPDPTANLEGTFGFLARRLGFFKDKIAQDLPLRAVVAFVRHRNLVDHLVEQLRIAEEAQQARLGRPLAYRELEALLDQYCRESACVEKLSEQLERRARERGPEQRPELRPGQRSLNGLEDRAPNMSPRCESLFTPG